MTLPFVVTMASLTAWFVLVLIPTKESTADFVKWLQDVCRILFAASALVVLYSSINKSVI